MKKYKIILSFLAAAVLTLTGCSESDGQAQQATDYMSEEASTESSEDSSGSESSIMVIKDLFEPEIEEKVSSEASTTASTEAEEEKSDDPVEIVFFGDSQIATGRDDGTDIPSFIGQRVPHSIVYNLAIGGTTASVDKTTSDVSAEKLHSTSFLGMTYCLAGKSEREATLSQNPAVLERMNKVDPQRVDYYIIEYGANDFFNEVPLDASMYDSEGDQAHAFYNAMCKGIDVLRDVSPNATFIIVSPFYGIYVDANGAYIGDSYIVSNGIGTLADYAKKAQNVSEDKQAYFFDGMFKSKCDLYLDTASQYLFDNLHLNETGRRIFARLIAHIVNFKEGNEPYAYLETDFIKIAEFDPNYDYRYDEGQMKEYFPESWEKYIKGEFPLAQPSAEALEQWGDEANSESSN